MKLENQIDYLKVLINKRGYITSSDWPPDKKTIPGTAGGMVRLKAVTVAQPTSSAVALTEKLK
jgi:hypothetical protein